MADDVLDHSTAAACEELQPADTGRASATPDILIAVRKQAAVEGLSDAGGIPPNQAWALISSGAASLLDVRTGEERKFVGHVPEGLHVPWATGTAMTRNPRFVREVEAKVKDKSTALLLLCRSGKRSVAAAEVLAKAGFSNVFNVLEGFEGELDQHQRRGTADGIRGARAALQSRAMGAGG